MHSTPDRTGSRFDGFLEAEIRGSVRIYRVLPGRSGAGTAISDCSRPSETKRRTWRFGDRSKGEPVVVNFVVKLCAECAKVWDRVEIEETVEGGR